MTTDARLAGIAANAVWGDIDWARARLKAFAGRTVHVTPWPLPGFTLRITTDGTWENATLASSQDADVRIRLSPAMLPRFAAAPDKPGSALDGDGDPEFLQALRDLGDVLPLAIEERLASFIGPLAAHGVASTVQALSAWPAAAAGRINAGFGAYFTEETRALPKRSAFNAFKDELERVSTRVAALESTVATKSAAQFPTD
jgi:ubiquinone biosynthesis protein UbiJ